MFLAKTLRKSAAGKPLIYWILRETKWDKKEQRLKSHYLAYVGPSTRITRKRAKEIATKVGCTVEDLSRIRRLRIIENGKAAA